MRTSLAVSLLALSALIANEACGQALEVPRKGAKLDTNPRRANVIINRNRADLGGDVEVDANARTNRTGTDVDATIQGNDPTVRENRSEDNRWRYKWHNNHWWYWKPNNSWVFYHNDGWIPYDSTTYYIYYPRSSARGRYNTGYRGSYDRNNVERNNGRYGNPYNSRSGNVGAELGGAIGGREGAGVGSAIGNAIEQD